MRRHLFLLLSLVAAVAILANCGGSAESEPAQLTFEVSMSVDASQQLHVNLGVRNVGQSRFREYKDFNGVMELRDAAGAKVSRIAMATLWELAPGNAGWPAAYTSKLPAGAYQLTWGAPDHGSVTVDFTVVELDGRLHLGQESIQTTAGDS